MVDLTADFRRLCGVGAPPAAAPPGRREAALAGTFMSAVEDLAASLLDIQQELRRNPDQSDSIRSCQDRMKDLEVLASDLSDLKLSDIGVSASMLQPPLNRDLLAHRKGAVGLLYECLMDLASKVQTSQVEELQRQAEVSNFFSMESSQSGPRRRKLPAATWEPSNTPAVAAPGLEDESRALLQSYESNLDKLQELNTKIVEIGRLMELLGTKVAGQESMIENIHEDTKEATGHIEDATKHLQRAVTNSNSYRFYVVCWFLGSAFALLVFDFIDSRWSPI